jgi:hypothetical protein
MVVLPAGSVAGQDSQAEWPSFRGAGHLQSLDRIGLTVRDRHLIEPGLQKGPELTMAIKESELYSSLW